MNTFVVTDSKGDILWGQSEVGEAPKKITVDYAPGLMKVLNEGAIPRKAFQHMIDLANSGDVEQPIHVQESWDEIKGLVQQELQHHERKWGVQYHTIPEWFMITAEEYGEAFKAANEKGWFELRDEIIDTIACLVQTYEEVKRMIDGRSDGNYTEVNTERSEADS